MLNWLRSLWKNHGTKVIGYATGVIGTLVELDHETVKAVESVLGPVWGPRFGLGLLIVSGYMTAARGHANTKALAQ